MVKLLLNLNKTGSGMKIGNTKCYSKDLDICVSRSKDYGRCYESAKILKRETLVLYNLWLSLMPTWS